jgi:hypothetical protein
MKPSISVALAALACTSCRNPLPALLGKPTLEAEFRRDAKQMYAELRMPSCKAPKGFDGQTRLQPETQAVQSFERETLSTPAHGHLLIASADAAFERGRDGGCWAEAWANQHIDTTRETVRVTLPFLRASASSLQKGPSSALLNSANGPEFRYLVRQVIALTRPLCPLTETEDDKRVLPPAKSELARFRVSLDWTSNAEQFDIAEADVAYELSITVVECSEPSPRKPDPNEVSAQLLAEVKRQVGAIRKLVETR